MKSWTYVKGLVFFVFFNLSPADWNVKSGAKVLLVLGTTVGLMAVDKNIQDYVHQDLGLSGKNVLWLERGLNGASLTGYMTVAYVAGLALKNNAITRITLVCAEGFVLSGAATQVLKYVFGRHRPNSMDPSTTWDGPRIKRDQAKWPSFPSSHTAVVFAIATVLFFEVRNKWVGGTAFLLAVLTGITRVIKSQHWASDAFFGGVLGYVIARRLLEYNSCWKIKEKKNPVS